MISKLWPSPTISAKLQQFWNLSICWRWLWLQLSYCSAFTKTTSFPQKRRKMLEQFWYFLGGVQQFDDCQRLACSNMFWHSFLTFWQCPTSNPPDPGPQCIWGPAQNVKFGDETSPSKIWRKILAALFAEILATQSLCILNIELTFFFAPATIPRPRGPQPEMTTTSSQPIYCQ